MALEAETEFFNRMRDRWISEGHGGQWAAVHGERLLGFYPSLAAAYQAGVDEWGDAEFLAKQVTPQDEIETIQRVQWGTRGQSAVKEKGA